MGFNELLAMTGLSDLISDEFFIAQIGVLSLTVVLFVCSLVFCLMAFRAAGAARKARGEAHDLAVEVRHLTAQVEKSTSRRPPARASASETMPEADIEIVDQSAHDDDDDPTDGAFDEQRDASGRTLEAAKKAATVPSALLGGFLRRRS